MAKPFMVGHHHALNYDLPSQRKYSTILKKEVNPFLRKSRPFGKIYHLFLWKGLTLFCKNSCCFMTKLSYLFFTKIIEFYERAGNAFVKTFISFKKLVVFLRKVYWGLGIKRGNVFILTHPLFYFRNQHAKLLYRIRMIC